MLQFYDLSITFILFSICGWICECIFCSVNERKLVNRGFLNGPVCPIYGFGGLVVVYVLAPLRHTVVLLFLCGMLCATALEYVASWVLEKLFHTSWWDYTDLKLNLNGRVCLQFSVIFGLLSVVAVHFIYPPFWKLVTAVPAWVKPWLSWSLLGVFITDCAYTTYSILALNGRLAELNRISTEMKQRVEAAYNSRLAAHEWRERLRLDRGQWAPSLREAVEELAQKLEEKKQKTAGQMQNRRLLRAFPNMKSNRYQEQLHDIKNAWQQRKKGGN